MWPVDGASCGTADFHGLVVTVVCRIDPGPSVILFGVCAGPTDRFERISRPALDTVACWDDRIILRNQSSIASAYNQILDQASKRDDLEAVVLLHDDVELDDREWRAKLLHALASRDVALVGVVGGAGGGGMAWWSRESWYGHVREPALTHDYGRRSAEVDVLDGLLIALSPWAVRNLRFDDAYPPFHGYDADICSQTIAHGKRVVVAPIDVIHHTDGAFGNSTSYRDWIRATLEWRIKWGDLNRRQRAMHRIRCATLGLEVRLRPSIRARCRSLARPGRRRDEDLTGE